MRQKFFIARDTGKDKLNIKEYALVQNARKNATSTMLSNETFAMVGEETYDGALIVEAIERGRTALVASLRTTNMFPIGSYAIKIAESVMALYDSQNDNSIELLFDDIDQLSNEPL
jgi:hypothetical protein